MMLGFFGLRVVQILYDVVRLLTLAPAIGAGATDARRLDDGFVELP